MNREERRKFGVSKETSDKLDAYNAPCTIKEVIQIARAAAEDTMEIAIGEYQKRTSPLQVAISLQVELLKEIVIKAGLVTEEEFRKLYMEKADKFNEMQKAQFDKAGSAPSLKIDPKANDIEVKVEG